MARVVQQRSNAPYLLIMFIFLFLLATVLAVVFYNGQATIGKELVTEKSKTDELSRKYEAATGVKGGVLGDIPTLLQLITGMPQGITPQLAEEQAKSCLSLPHSQDYKNSGLVAAVREMNAKINQKDLQIKSLESDKNGLSEDMDKTKATFAEASKASAEELKKAQEKANAATDMLSDAGKEVLKQLETFRAESAATIADKDKRIAAMVDEMGTKDGQMREKDKKIVELEDVIRKLKPQLKAGELMLRRPDGRIARVLANKNICYIDMGRHNNIVPGLPFSVYSAQTGIPENGLPKAKIVVINVAPDVSECRIVESSRENPVVEGDQIANVVYNPERAYHFVVVGDFDLYNEGKTDPTGNRQVRTMIESYGGKLQEEVGVTTDFVVMGEEPGHPSRPAPDAPPSTWQLYNDKMKKVEHYEQVKGQAASLGIPVLNTNRFMAFTGFVPKKRLSE